MTTREDRVRQAIAVAILLGTDSSAPHRLLLFPLFVLLGVIPWLVAGRGTHRTG